MMKIGFGDLFLQVKKRIYTLIVIKASSILQISLVAVNLHCHLQAIKPSLSLKLSPKRKLKPAHKKASLNQQKEKLPKGK